MRVIYIPVLELRSVRMQTPTMHLYVHPRLPRLGNEECYAPPQTEGRQTTVRLLRGGLAWHHSLVKLTIPRGFPPN